nr:tetratricopeptide repeat protein [Variovorax boronicumulans]
MTVTTTTSRRRGATRLLLALACAATLAGPALAADASLDQVYQAAYGGHVDQALQMMDPVLRDHPNSAKAHYVEAELLAQQGRLGPARTELATAERLAPGLPFVQEQSLQHLHRVLDQAPVATGRTALTMPAAEAAHGRPLAWGLGLAVAFGALLGWLLTRANRPRPTPQGQDMVPMAAAGPSMAWPRGPVSSEGAAPWGAAPAPAAGPGWGTQVAAGVAGGLAAGAAAVAGQELGRRLFGHEAVAAPASVPYAAPQTPVAPVAPVADGWSDPDFGIRDAGAGWDDDTTDRDAGGLGGNWDV